MPLLKKLLLPLAPLTILLAAACGGDDGTAEPGTSPVDGGTPTADGGGPAPEDSGPNQPEPVFDGGDEDGGDGGDIDAGPLTFSVGGTIAGLPMGGSVKLKNNGGDELTRSANGAYAFVTRLMTGAPYDVTVSASPAGYECTVAGGKGTIAAADVSTANVTCAKLPSSCKEVLAANGAAADGVYSLYAGGMSFNAYCDMTTDGGGWTKILQYKDAAYTPTTAAAGTIAVAGTPAFAKLSDAQINAVGGAVAKVYRYMGNKTPKKLFVQTAGVYDDTARSMGLAGAVDVCEAATFAECSARPAAVGTWTDSLHMGVAPDNEERYFTDHNGTGQCWPNAVGGDRCFSTGASLGYARIDDFSLWLREVDALPAPFAHWKLDENNGTTFADSSGNGYTATATPGTWVAGHAGSGYSGVAVMNGDLPDLTAFTVSLWAKREGAGNAFPRLVSFPLDAFEISSRDANDFAHVYVPGAWRVTAAVLPLNVYTHLVVSAGGGRVHVFENGVHKTSFAASPTIGGKMSFGVRSNGGGEPFVGAYDDVRIYSRPLWPSQVDALSKL